MNSIIGTWELVSLEVKNSKHILTPFGKNVKGLLIYQSNGFMSGIISGEERPQVSSAALFGLSEKERSEIAKNFIAYAGTFHVENDKIIHHVKVSFIPNLMVKSAHTSSFSLNNNRLEITSKQADKTGETITITLIWQWLG